MVRAIEESGHGQALFPQRMKKILKNGAWIERPTALLPGYVFVYSDEETVNFSGFPGAQHVIRMLTYGDGVSNVDLDALVAFHKQHGKIATLTGVNIGQRFGVMDVDSDGHIREFREKNDDDGKIVNGGFMVLEPGVFDYIEGDDTVFEKAPLEQLAKDGQLMVYRHDGFWKCMDTQRDKMQLEQMWQEGNAPWKLWK